MIRLIFLLLPCLSLGVKIEQPPPWLANFSRHIVDRFHTQSGFHLVEKELRSLLPHLRVKEENAEEALREAHSAISSLLHKRRKAVQELVRVAEETVDKELTIPPIREDYWAWVNQAWQEKPEDKEDTTGYEFKLIKECDFKEMNQYDVRNLTGKMNTSAASAVHINFESYKCDPSVVRDFTWTGSPSIEAAFARNKAADSALSNQFIGTYTGITRMSPRERQWEIEPAAITVDLFDPKFRPWFTNAEAAPKDIVFLLDYSGSTKGPTMHLSRITLLYILSTLNPNDYISGVWFNKAFDKVLKCDMDDFIPATTRNKKIFYESSLKEETEKAELGPPLKMGIEMLRNQSSVLFGDARSGSHKIIILMTDGIDEWPHSIIEETLETVQGDRIRVYGMAMGFGTGRLPLLDHLACISNATSSLVDSISDVKIQSRSYLNHLSDIHAVTLRGIVPIAKRPVSWTNLYMDNQAAGPVISLSSPITLRPDNNWNSSSRMAGVAGVDVHIKEFTQHLPASDRLNAFIVDNNGMVIYHRDHRLPKTEVHAIRRSACYESSHIKKTRHGFRVQYGHSDERVYRLVGLLDSIPTIDLYELEGADRKSVQNLRKQIMNGRCDGKTRIPDEKESGSYYICQSIADTPLTIVIYHSASIPTYEYIGPPIHEEQLYCKNKLVEYLMTRRYSCNWDVDKITDETQSSVSLERLRYSAWMASPTCQDNPTESFARAMAKTVKTWAESWRLPANNIDYCKQPLDTDIPFNLTNYLNSFVYTRGQMSAYYPMCIESEKSMKEVTMKMEKERLWAGSDDIQFSVRGDFLIIYKAIMDSNRNRLAVVGVQWRLGSLSDDFVQWMNNQTAPGTKGQPPVTNPCNEDNCLLITRSTYVVAKNRISGRSHAPLFDFDPQAFDYLQKHKEIQSEESIDYQAECEVERNKTGFYASPAASPAAPLQSILHAASRLLSSLLSINFSLLASPFLSLASAQPKIMKNGSCHFQEIVPYERCAYRQYQHVLMRNASQGQFLMDKCGRWGRLHDVTDTRLKLLIVKRAPCHAFIPNNSIGFERKRILNCESVANNPRRRPVYNYTISSPHEVDLGCRPSSFSTRHNAFIITIISTIVFYAFQISL